MLLGMLCVLGMACWAQRELPRQRSVGANCYHAAARCLPAHCEPCSSSSRLAGSSRLAATGDSLTEAATLETGLQEWGQPGALPSLMQLRVDSNRL